MAERVKDREHETRANVQRDVDFRADIDNLVARALPESTRNDDDNSTALLPQTTSTKFTPPTWLKGMFPIPWSSSDGCRKIVRHGQNCCLFYPLGYCRDTDVINGFCVFHLRAIFNLVYQTDCVYLMNPEHKPAMSQRTACYVAEPQVINDEYTAVFPVMELINEEIRMPDIKLHNLSKHLQMHGTQNWERIYANHVNYLYRLLTLFSPRQAAQNPIETRVDQLTNTQLMMHWNLWNEYHSKVLVDNPADLNAFYVSEQRDDVLPLPINRCTTITQMIARLFGEPYTSYNGQRFFSMVANYGIYARSHWTYANNLCAIGTHCTKGNLPCIGNAATLSMLRIDSGSCHRSTVHYSRLSECGTNYCVPSRLNLDAPSLNQAVVYSTRQGPPASSNPPA